MSEGFGSSDWCFACGSENPAGLGLEFRSDGTGVQAGFCPCREHQGYNGIVHGGILTTLLDEAMAQAVIARGLEAFTARLEVRFQDPLRVGEPCTVRGWLEREREPIFYLRATVEKEGTGRVVASGRASFMIKGGKDGNNEEGRGPGPG